jgi:hypothetical protein
MLYPPDEPEAVDALELCSGVRYPTRSADIADLLGDELESSRFQISFTAGTPTELGFVVMLPIAGRLRLRAPLADM